MKKILLIGTVLGLVMVFCLQVFGATSYVGKATNLFTNGVVQITYPNDKAEFVFVTNLSTNSIYVGASPTVSATTYAIILTNGQSYVFNKAQNGIPPKLYAVSVLNQANVVTNPVYSETWVQ